MPTARTKSRPIPRLEPAPESEPSPLRVALAQIAPALGDRRRNLHLHRERIEEASAAGASLIVFPELSLTGYYLRDMVPDVALKSDAPELLDAISAAGEMDVAFGFVEDGAGDRYYNAAAYASEGRVLHVHRKVYLPTYGLFDEARYFARGERIAAFDVPRLGRVGLVVCEDFWHLSVMAVMQAERIDLLICIANSPGRGVDQPRFRTADTYERLCRTYAQLLGAAVIFVNRVGFEDGLCFWGGSMAAGPSGELLAQAPMFDESLAVATLDFDELRRERIITPLARDERLLLTLEELDRIKRARYE